MGISAELWGKEAWRFIHYVALNYPDTPTETDKSKYLNFINALPDVLPCPICGIHFADNKEKHPPLLDNRIDFFKWTVDMHNFVNEVNDKKKLSYEDAYNQVWKKYKLIEEKQFTETELKASFLLSKIKNLKK
jgi:FAD-linked sulfhydryl oxidase